MKKFIFCILSFIFLTASILSGKADDNNSLVIKVEANPINIAAQLVLIQDKDKLISSLDYYGYTPLDSGIWTLDSDHGTSAVFTHPNGSQIRYQFNNGNIYPSIEVHSKASAKEKDQILKSLNFHKAGNSYNRETIGCTTNCSSGPHNSLIFNATSSKSTL